MMSKTRMIDPITQGCAFSLLDADAKENFNKHIDQFMKYEIGRASCRERVYA
jgi:hypothetical protein